MVLLQFKTINNIIWVYKVSLEDSQSKKSIAKFSEFYNYIIIRFRKKSRDKIALFDILKLQNRNNFIELLEENNYRNIKTSINNLIDKLQLDIPKFSEIEDIDNMQFIKDD